MPSEKRQPKEVDVSKFEPLVQEALKAIATDVGYAIAISRSAVSIEKKREVWQARFAERKAEGSDE